MPEVKPRSRRAKLGSSWRYTWAAPRVYLPPSHSQPAHYCASDVHHPQTRHRNTLPGTVKHRRPSIPRCKRRMEVLAATHRHARTIFSRCVHTTHITRPHVNSIRRGAAYAASGQDWMELEVHPITQGSISQRPTVSPRATQASPKTHYRNTQHIITTSPSQRTSAYTTHSNKRLKPQYNAEQLAGATSSDRWRYTHSFI